MCDLVVALVGWCRV